MISLIHHVGSSKRRANDGKLYVHLELEVKL
jgi:hypothetical protein